MLTRNRGRPTSIVANLGLLKRNKKQKTKEMPIIRRGPGRPPKFRNTVASAISVDVKMPGNTIRVESTVSKKIKMKNLMFKSCSNPIKKSADAAVRKFVSRRETLRKISAKKLLKRELIIRNLREKSREKLTSAAASDNTATKIDLPLLPHKRGRKSKAIVLLPNLSEGKTNATEAPTAKTLQNFETSNFVEKSEDAAQDNITIKSSITSSLDSEITATKLDVDKENFPVTEPADLKIEVSKNVNFPSPKKAFAQISFATRRCFNSFDDVLQEMLEEVSKTGIVFSSKRHYAQARSLNQESNEKTVKNAVFVFSNPELGSMLEKFGSVDELNKQLDAKDSLLASVGLTRPGMSEALRRRREEKTKQPNRNIMGRLRPNPRPRRYSDMITQKVPPDSSSLSHSEIYTHQNDHRPARIRESLSKAKFTQVKSRQQHTTVVSQHQPTPLEHPGRGRPRKSTCPVNRTASKNDGKLMHNYISTRPRRRLDMRQHIEWKFCYVDNNKKFQSLGLQYRKRRHSMFPPEQLSTHGSDEDEYLSEVGENKKKLADEDVEDAISFNTSDSRKADENDFASNSRSDELTEGMEQSPMKKPSESKKRHHSILFKRKRPSTLTHKSIDDGSEKSDSVGRVYHGRLSSPSSDTSSQSGPSDIFGRTIKNDRVSSRFIGQSNAPVSLKLRAGTWSPLSSKSSINRRTKDLLDSDIPSRGSDECSHRSRRISPSRRLLHHRHDQLRRLTLLDRVVLGLNCNVSPNGDQIHITQLHAEDLNILTQRLSETGFYIESLALKPNHNNEAEYNIVLTYASNYDADARRVRRYNSPPPLREANDSLIKPITETVLSRQHDLTVEAFDQASPIKSISYKRNPVEKIIEQGYHNDARSVATGPESIRFPMTQSDDEELLSLSSKRHADSTITAINKGSNSPPRPSSSNEPAPRTDVEKSVSGSIDEINSRFGRMGSGDILGRTRRPRFHSKLTAMKYASYRKKFGYHSLLPKNRSLGDNFSLYNKLRVSRRASEDDGDDGGSDSQSKLQSVSLDGYALVAGRIGESALETIGHLPLFRRHSPRKLIRKVYTGTSTVPKILNRKRPIGIPAVVSSAADGINSTNSNTISVSNSNPASASALPLQPSVARQVTVNVLEPSQLVGAAFNRPSLSQSVSTNVYNVGSLSNIGVPNEEPIVVQPERVRPFLISKVKSAVNTGIINEEKAEVISPSSSPLLFLSGKQSTETDSNTVQPEIANRPLLTSSISLPQQPTSLEREVDIHSLGQEAVGAETIHTSTVVASSSPVCTRAAEDLTTSNSKTLDTPEGNGARCSKEENVYNPAKSMSASQILRLRRMNDEPGRPSSASESLPSYSRNQVLTQQLSSQQCMPQNQPKFAPVISSGLSLVDTGPAFVALDCDVDADEAPLDTNEATAVDGVDFEFKPIVSKLGPTHTQMLPKLTTSPATLPPFSLNLPYPFHNQQQNQFPGSRGLTTAATPALPSSIMASEVTPTKVYTVKQFSKTALTTNRSSIRQFSPSFVSYLPSSKSLTSSKAFSSGGSALAADNLQISASSTIIHSFKPTESPCLTGQPVFATSATNVSGSKRAVVHKYHSFRKLSPKSASAAVVSAVGSPAQSSQPSLSGPPKRSESLKPTAASSTNSGSSLFASQLLKSLLESGGSGRESIGGCGLVSTAVATLSSSTVSSSGWNQPAHHSRGTWQLGGRAVVLGATRLLSRPPSIVSASPAKLSSDSVIPSVARCAPNISVSNNDVSVSMSSTVVVGSDELLSSELVPQAAFHETIGS